VTTSAFCANARVVRSPDRYGLASVYTRAAVAPDAGVATSHRSVVVKVSASTTVTLKNRVPM